MSTVPAGFIKIDASRFECAVFALCDRSAVGFYPHPILGPVPSCKRCADRLGYVLGDAYLGPDPTCSYGDASEPEHDHGACLDA